MAEESTQNIDENSSPTLTYPVGGERLAHGHSVLRQSAIASPKGRQSGFR